jgi:hypothetical protein
VRSLLACAVVLGLCSAWGPVARAGGASEEQVKAAYLFNFARFVEWPDSAFASSGSPIVIGVIGDESFAGILDKTIAGKRVGDRAVRVEHHSGPETALRSHILFVQSKEVSLLSEVADVMRGRAVFTVADDENFAAHGGVANFFRMDKKVRFAINESAARSAGLKVSSRLLRLAKVLK